MHLGITSQQRDLKPLCRRRDEAVWQIRHLETVDARDSQRDRMIERQHDQDRDAARDSLIEAPQCLGRNPASFDQIR